MMATPAAVAFAVNGRSYSPPPKPIVVVCLDGSADEYLDAALARGLMPNLQNFAVNGHRGFARGAMPSFTNVNNASITTGVAPDKHGIGGNFFFERESGQEVMMNSSRFLRTETILFAAAKAGRNVGFVTAKEKLRDIFSVGFFPPRKGLNAIAFSTEKARDARVETHGIENVEQLVGRPTPQIYSGDASIYVLDAGVALLANGVADFLYLSTTDFIQHKHAPEEAEALAFYAGIDERLGKLAALGALLGVTADHGMNSKQRPDGSPNVLYLETMLRERFQADFRVILPITDPYVVHHGALGSFAVIHGPSTLNWPEVAAWLNSLEGVTEVHDQATAARKLELPIDRLGDLVVLGGRNVVLGRSTEYHDLKAIEGGLRSHGGRYEEMVPFLTNHPLKSDYAARARGDVRNFDIFDFVCNGMEAA